MIWSAAETNEDVLESEAGGDHYQWFTYIDADELAIDNASVVPEPATMGLLAIGGLAVLRRRRRKC